MPGKARPIKTFKAGLVLLLIFLVGCRESQPLRLSDDPAEIGKSLDAVIPGLLQKHKVPGISVSIVRNGTLLLSRSYGVRRSDREEPVSENTVFEAASLGKPVFAYLVLRLVEQGVLTLDAPLVRYIPALFAGADERMQAITARMVLSHTSGLPNFGGDVSKLKFKPGSDFHYSGVGIRALQNIIERLTGKSLDDLSGEYVFEPANMRLSSYVWQKAFAANFADGHDENRKRMVSSDRNRSPNAAFSLYTTSANYARFMSFLINEADNGSAAAVRLFEQQIKITDKISWGLGWGLQATKPNASFWHWGSNPGYRAYAVGYPKEKIAVVVLGNGEAVFKAMDDIIKLAIGGELPSYDWF